jgi:hypothetical protein
VYDLTDLTRRLDKLIVQNFVGVRQEYPEVTPEVIDIVDALE